MDAGHGHMDARHQSQIAAGCDNEVHAETAVPCQLLAHSHFIEIWDKFDADAGLRGDIEYEAHPGPLCTGASAAYSTFIFV